MNPEVIRALTPVFLAFIGGLIGFVSLFKDLEPSQMTAGMGLAGTAIAGAAGLAQTTKSESNVAIEEEGKKLRAGDNETA